MTYTVTDISGNVLGRGLTAIEAMDAILTDDGYRWEIRREKGEWVLYHSDGSMNSTRGARHMVRTIATSLARNRAQAEAEIAQTVIAANWRGLPFAIEE